MSQLSFTSVPGFTDVADSAIAGDKALTDNALQAVSHNSKFGIVRCELIIMGFYGDGDTIPTPVSPVDGYAYSRAECIFWWTIYSNRARQQPFTAGQQYPPPQSNSQPQNGLYNFPGGWDINDLTGVVSLRTSYYSGGGAEVVTNDGIIKVICVAQRSSISVAN